MTATPQNCALVQGDALDVLRTFSPGMFRCCVTSPPYFGLRDYGVEGQLGLEQTPDEYVARLVAIFEEVRRVLTDDGTLWLNLGDSYVTGPSGSRDPDRWPIQSRRDRKEFEDTRGSSDNSTGRSGRPAVRKSFPGSKPKDLIGIPWMAAFALRAAGWYLRCDIVWAKGNPLPESVSDRFTRAHEFIFLMAKGQRSTRTVSFFDLQPEFVHFGRGLGGTSKYMGLAKDAIRFATAIFDGAQEESNFRLPPFYSEEWKKGPQGEDSDFVVRLPPNHRASTYAARFLDGDISTKEFFCEVHRLWGNLGDVDQLLVHRILAEGALSPGVLADRNAPVAINDSGEVRKFDFCHGHVVTEKSTSCDYYFDVDAVKESIAESSKKDKRRLSERPRDYAAAAAAFGEGTSASRRTAGGAFFSPASWRGSSFNKGKTAASQIGAQSEDDRKNNSAAAAAARTDGAHTIAGFQDRWDAGEKPELRRKRDVWNVSSEPYKGSHYAVMPTKLVEPCILAGSAPDDIILDPFYGSGTVGVVALRHGNRRFVGIDLDPKNEALAMERITNAKEAA